MGTKIFGYSDDLIEFEGDADGETGAVFDRETLVFCSDVTVLSFEYRGNDNGIWKICLVHEGNLLKQISPLTVGDIADGNYSDIAVFYNGLRWAYTASEWEKAN